MSDGKTDPTPKKISKLKPTKKVKEPTGATLAVRRRRAIAHFGPDADGAALVPTDNTGMPPFEPTAKERKEVERLSGLGLSARDISFLIREGVAETSVIDHFPLELERGRSMANQLVAGALFRKATGGDTPAAIWWTKARMGWKETSRSEVSGPDGGPVAIAQLPADPVEAAKVYAAIMGS